MANEDQMKNTNHIKKQRLPGKMEQAVTVGDLEALAGLPQDERNRFNFWLRYMNSPDPLAEGTAELRRRILARIEHGVVSPVPA